MVEATGRLWIRRPSCLDMPDHLEPPASLVGIFFCVGRSQQVFLTAIANGPATVDSPRANEDVDMDAVRQLTTRRLEETDLSMKEVSLAIGHAYSFLQQFLTGTSPPPNARARPRSIAAPSIETLTQRGNLLTYTRAFLKTCPPFMITEKFL